MLRCCRMVRMIARMRASGMRIMALYVTLKARSKCSTGLERMGIGRVTMGSATGLNGRWGIANVGLREIGALGRIPLVSLNRSKVASQRHMVSDVGGWMIVWSGWMCWLTWRYSLVGS